MKFLLFLAFLFYKFDNLTFALYDTQRPSPSSTNLQLPSSSFSLSDPETNKQLHSSTNEIETVPAHDVDYLKNGLLFHLRRSIRSDDGDIETRRRIDKNFMRFGRSNSGKEMMRFGRSHLMRFGRADSESGKHLMRFGRAKSNSLMRFGRAHDHLMRFGKRDNHLMRFGRTPNNNLMRFGRSFADHKMRFGRSGYESQKEDTLSEDDDSNKLKNFLMLGQLESTPSAESEESNRNNVLIK